jgi:hypothetical protein
MDFFGIGILEIIFVLFIALVLMGPEDMVKAGRTLGRVMRTFVLSPYWRWMQDIGRQVKYAPNRLMREAAREAGLDELGKELPNAEELRKRMGMDIPASEVNRWRDDLKRADQSIQRSILPPGAAQPPTVITGPTPPTNPSGPPPFVAPTPPADAPPPTPPTE